MKRSRKTAVQIIGGVLLAAVLSGRGQPDFSEKGNNGYENFKVEEQTEQEGDYGEPLLST